MPKVKLNELMNSGEILESNKSSKPGLLRTVYAKVADYLANRNGRTYPKSVWEKSSKSDLVTEQMEMGCFFGEVNHPFDDRMEIDLNNVSHNIRNLDVKDDGVYANIDILDTPGGKLINTLLEYGSKIGISSRGCGSLDESNNEVQDDYQLFAFDIVARPSVAAARLTESEQLVKDGKAIMTEDEIHNVIKTYRQSVLKESSLKEDNSFSTDKLVKQLIKESEELNKKGRI